MARWLKQSTSVDVPIGPFLDATDGVTAETGLTITQPDIRLKKNGGAWAQKAAAQTLSHEENGNYEVTLDATDTNTLGLLRLHVAESGALPVWEDFLVLPANVYDALVSASDALQVHTNEITNDLITAAVIADNAIDAGAIASNAITSAKIATGAITTATFAAGAINAAAIAADAITDAKVASDVTIASVTGSVGSVASGGITSASFASGAITATAIASDAITDAKVASDVTIASVTGAVGSVTGNVGGNVAGSVASVTGNVGGNVAGSVGSVTTVSDKTGYALSAAGVDAVWDEAMSGHTTAGTYGDKLRAHAAGVLKALITTGSSTTSVVLNGSTGIEGGAPSATNDFYNGRVIIFITGALAGQATDITDYVGATTTLTVTALTSAPSSGDTAVIV
jgi:hypothetical protein